MGMKENINESLLNAVNGIINEATAAPSRNRASQRSSRGRAFDPRATNPDAAPRTQQQQQGMNMLGPVWDRRPKPNQPNRPTRGDAQNPSERDATSSLSATNARTKNPSFVLGKPLPKNPPRDPEGGRGRGDGKGGEPTMRLGPDWEGGRERGSIKPVEAIRTQRSDVPFSSPLIPRDLSSSSPMSIPSSMPRPRLPRNPDLTQRSISRDRMEPPIYSDPDLEIEDDYDQDGIPNYADETPGRPPKPSDKPLYSDQDLNVDDDYDQDGIPNYADPTPGRPPKPREQTPDDDGDGVPDLLDPTAPRDPMGDDDGDGLPNYADQDYSPPTDSDEDGIPDGEIDSDGDGIADACEYGQCDPFDNPGILQDIDDYIDIPFYDPRSPYEPFSGITRKNDQIGTDGSRANPMHMGSASAFIGDPANGKDAARYYWQSAKTYTGKGNRESGMKGGIRFGGGPKASAAQAYNNNASKTISVGGKPQPGLDAPEGLGETTMNYGKARAIVESVLEQLDEAVSAKDLRKKIDLHGNQVKVHSQLYNKSMDTSHRDQAYAHGDAHKKAWAEGSHASSGPHLRDVPSHADYHNA